MIIYLSGPMSGLVDKNYPEFRRVAKLLKDRGHQVIDPSENFGGDQTKDWSTYMRLDIENVLLVDAMIMLDGWQYSTGAKLEAAIAQALNIPMYNVNDFLKNSRTAQLKPAIYISVTV